MTKKPKKDKKQVRIFATEQTRLQLRALAAAEQRDGIVVLERIVGAAHAKLPSPPVP